MIEIVLLFDFLAAAGIIVVAYLLYKKYHAGNTSAKRSRDIAYEEGFTDAVKYFGLKKLYEEDKQLKNHMEKVFGEAGITHRIATMLNSSDRKGD